MAATEEIVEPRAARRGRSGRRGSVVAVLGPDGSGKSTVVARVVAAVPGARTLYGGLYPAGQRHSGVAWVIGRMVLLAAAVRWHRGRGRVVLLDRHPLDVAAAPPTHRRRARLRRSVLRSLGVRLDRLVVLDAPAELLRSRKREQSLEQLQRQRDGYRSLAAAWPGAVVVDASQGLDQVVSDVLQAIGRAGSS
jgi:thymidylate kinase